MGGLPHVNPSTSPRRAPVNVRKRITATSVGYACAASLRAIANLRYPAESRYCALKLVLCLRRPAQGLDPGGRNPVSSAWRISDDSTASARLRVPAERASPRCQFSTSPRPIPEMLRLPKNGRIWPVRLWRCPLRVAGFHWPRQPLKKLRRKIRQRDISTCFGTRLG